MATTFYLVVALLVIPGLLLWWEVAASRIMHDCEWDHLDFDSDEEDEP